MLLVQDRSHDLLTSIPARYHCTTDALKRERKYAEVHCTYTYEHNEIRAISLSRNKSV